MERFTVVDESERPHSANEGVTVHRGSKKHHYYDHERLLTISSSTTSSNGSSTDNNHNNNGNNMNLSEFFLRTMHEVIDNNLIRKDSIEQTKQLIFGANNFQPSPRSRFMIVDCEEKIEKVSQWIQTIPKVTPHNSITMEKKVKFHEKAILLVERKKSFGKSVESGSSGNGENVQDNDNNGSSSSYDWIHLDPVVYEILQKIFATTETSEDTSFEYGSNDEDDDDYYYDDDDYDEDDDDQNGLTDQKSWPSKPTSSKLDPITPIANTTTTTEESIHHSNKLMTKILKACNPTKRVCVRDLKKSLSIFSALICGNQFNCSNRCSSCIDNRQWKFNEMIDNPRLQSRPVVRRSKSYLDFDANNTNHHFYNQNYYQNINYYFVKNSRIKRYKN